MEKTSKFEDSIPFFREQEQIYKRVGVNRGEEIAIKSFLKHVVLCGTKQYLPNKTPTLNLIHTQYYLLVIFHRVQECRVIKQLSRSRLNVEIKPSQNI